MNIKSEILNTNDNLYFMSAVLLIVGVGAWHAMYPNGEGGESNGKVEEKRKPTLKKVSMVNENIIIIETSEKPEINSPGKRAVGSRRAGATVRSLSDAELPDPETVKKFKDVFEALAKKQEMEDPENPQKSNSINRSKSMIVIRGRAWCNGGSGHIAHRNGACDAAIHTIRAVVSAKTPPRATAYHRSCSELDQFFQDDGESGGDEIWERYVNDGSPVSEEVIAKIRQHGTSVKFFGTEARAVVSGGERCRTDGDGGWQCENGFYDDDLLDYTLIHQHKPKIISAITKSNSTGSGSSCASSSSAFDDYETCSSGPTSPFSWLNLGGSLDRLRVVFGGVENDNFRMSPRTPPNSTSPSPMETPEFMKVLKPRSDTNGNYDDYNRHPSTYHGIWRKNPCWPGSYYVTYNFNLAKQIN